MLASPALYRLELKVEYASILFAKICGLRSLVNSWHVILIISEIIRDTCKSTIDISARMIVMKEAS